MKCSSSHFVKVCTSTLAVLDGNYFTNLVNNIISFDHISTLSFLFLRFLGPEKP